MNEILRAKCLATAIGSLPLTNPEEANALVMKYLPEIPASPELPKLGYKASFCGPVLENLPGLVEDDAREVFYFDTSKDNTDKFEEFYENYLSDNLDYFKISKERGIGFYSLLEQYKKNPNINTQYIKIQLPGPITTGLTIKDENGKNIIYNDEYTHMIAKAIIQKARWQIKEIQKINSNAKVIFFFDEPGLVNFGSSFFNIDRYTIIAAINEIYDSVNTICGSHCCGNTDWGLLMDTKLDIISFDAFTLSKVLNLYPEQLKKFLDRGGNIAWGIIPNSAEIFNWTSEKLVEKFNYEVTALSQIGISYEKILEASLITPCCGLGGTTPEVAKKVMEVMQKTSYALRKSMNW